MCLHTVIRVTLGREMPSSMCLLFEDTFYSKVLVSHSSSRPLCASVHTPCVHVCTNFRRRHPSRSNLGTNLRLGKWYVFTTVMYICQVQRPICTCISKQVHTQTYVLTYTHTYIMLHAYIHASIHACIHACIHTYIPTIFTYVRTKIQTVHIQV